MMSIKPAERPVFRLITWCTLYIFYFQVLSFSVLAYLPPTMIAPVSTVGESSIIDAVMSFFITPVQAATDEVKGVISAPNVPEDVRGVFSPFESTAGEPEGDVDYPRAAASASCAPGRRGRASGRPRPEPRRSPPGRRARRPGSDRRSRAQRARRPGSGRWTRSCPGPHPAWWGPAGW